MLESYVVTFIILFSHLDSTCAIKISFIPYVTCLEMVLFKLWVDVFPFMILSVYLNWIIMELSCFLLLIVPFDLLKNIKKTIKFVFSPANLTPDLDVGDLIFLSSIWFNILFSSTDLYTHNAASVDVSHLVYWVSFFHVAQHIELQLYDRHIVNTTDMKLHLFSWENLIIFNLYCIPF